MARNGVSMGAVTMVALAVGTLSTPVLYDSLGPRRFGVWAILNGLVSIVAFADLGLGSYQVIEVARALAGGCRRHARAALGLGVLWALGLGALLIAGTLVTWPWLAHGLHLGAMAGQARTALVLLLVGFVVNGTSVSWQAVLQGAQRYGSLARISAVAAVSGAGLSVLAATHGGGLEALAALTVVNNTAKTIVLAGAARRHVPALTPRLRGIRRTDLNAVTRYGARVQVSNAAAVINDRAGRLVLAGCSSPIAVADVDLGSRVPSLLRSLPVSALAVLFPAAVRAQAASVEELDRLYLVTTRYVCVYAAVVTAVLEVAADPLVRLWMGRPVPLATSTVLILAAGYAVNVTTAPAGVVTRSEGRPGRETRYALLSTCLNLALVLPLLKLLGPVGIPLSSTLSAVVASVYFFAHFHRSSRRPLAPLLRTVWPPALATVVAGLVTWLVLPGLPDGPGRWGAAAALASRAAVVTVTVGVCLALLGFCDRGDRVRLRTAAHRLLSRRGTAV